MTSFQLACVIAFVVIVVAAYSKDIYTAVASFMKRAPGVLPRTAETPAEELVDDLVTVAELRDRLTADGCKDGADACTILLRILVEFRPAK